MTRKQDEKMMIYKKWWQPWSRPFLTALRFCINSNQIHLSFMRDSFQDELFSFVIEFKFLLQRVVSTHCLSCFFAFFNLVPIRRSCLHLALAFYTRVCLPTPTATAPTIFCQPTERKCGDICETSDNFEINEKL